MHLYRTLQTFIMLICLSSSIAQAFAAQASEEIELVNQQLFLFFAESSEFNEEQALTAYQRQQFLPNISNRVSFGFSEQTLWAVLPMINDSQSEQVKVVKVDNAWLDEVDIYFYTNGRLQYQVSLGDSVVFTQRPMDKRMPSVTYAFPPGHTDILFRFRSEDPMTIPIYLGSEVDMVKAATNNAYFYGALYGALSILLIYNLTLYFYLRELKYFMYSVYLLAFTAFNFTYTGHGFWTLWPESIFLQQWLMPVLMFIYLFSGVMFTLEFLNTREFLPSLYAAKHKIYGGLLFFALLLLILADRTTAIMWQLVILTTVSFWMLLIGYFAYRNGNALAKFFVLAVIMGTGGATISSLATWGIIPYSQWAFRGIEIGMLLEMSLLSISLGFNFKMTQEARKNAETNARLDPLTNLYNRRAFTELVQPLWQLGKRNKVPMAMVLIDLDWFKRINDEYGHTVGDEVLEEVAKILKQRARDSDILLRWGGEEFLIFLPNTDRAEAQLLANSLRKHFDERNINLAYKVTMSIGVASGIPTEVELDKLIKMADDALYSAKNNGRNCVVVSQYRPSS